MGLCKAKEEEEEEEESMSLLENKHSEQRTRDFPYLPSGRVGVLCAMRSQRNDPGPWVSTITHSFLNDLKLLAKTI